MHSLFFSLFSFARKLQPMFVLVFEGALFAFPLPEESLSLFKLPPKRTATSADHLFSTYRHYPSYLILQIVLVGFIYKYVILLKSFRFRVFTLFRLFSVTLILRQRHTETATDVRTRIRRSVKRKPATRGIGAEGQVTPEKDSPS